MHCKKCGKALDPARREYFLVVTEVNAAELLTTCVECWPDTDKTREIKAKAEKIAQAKRKPWWQFWK